MAIVPDKTLRWRLFAAHIVLGTISVLCFLPFVALLLISLRPGNLESFGGHLSLEHWKLAFGIPFRNEEGDLVWPHYPALLWVWNSVKIALLSGCLSVGLSATSAFALVRLKLAAKRYWLLGLLFAQTIPSALFLVAVYSIFEAFGLCSDGVSFCMGLNSHFSLVAVYLGGLASYILIVKAYFDGVSVEVLDAAALDGATNWQLFWRVLLPIARPVFSAVFLLAFVGAMTEIPLASVLLEKEASLTLAVGARLYLYENYYLVGDFAAVMLLSGVPITLVLFLCQKWAFCADGEGCKSFVRYRMQ